jgi:hypothetical protein
VRYIIPVSGRAQVVPGRPCGDQRLQAIRCLGARCVWEGLMRLRAILVLLVVTGCTPSPVRFSEPAKDAPVWDLNPGEWPGTNTLLTPPGAS